MKAKNNVETKAKPGVRKDILMIGAVAITLGGAGIITGLHVNSLQQELESIHDDYMLSVEENRILKGQVSEYASLNLDLLSEVDGLNLENEELSNTIEGLKEENTELGKSIAALRTNIETLEAAQAARRISVNQADINLLAQIVAHEALSEPREGQKAVVHTLVNRINDDRFPNTVTAVVHQPNQISHLGQALNQPVRDEMVEVVLEALNEPDNTRGALFWWNSDIASCRWLNTRTPVARHGQHTFLR